MFEPIALQGDGAKSRLCGALGGWSTVLRYDSIRRLFPRRWFCTLCSYRHSNTLIASMFGMLSALIGNVVRFWQPWAQILPLMIGMATIAYFFIRLRQQDAARRTRAATGIG